MSDPNAIRPADLRAGSSSFAESWAARFTLPSDIVGQARRRLGLLGAAFAAMNIVLYPIFVVSSGIFEPIIAATAGITAVVSSAVFFASRSPRFTDASVVWIGLVYEILMCLSAATVSEMDVFLATGAPTQITGATTIIAVFPLIVPVTPALTLATSVVAAATAPFGLYLMHWAGFAGSPDAGMLIGVSLAPAASVLLAYMGSRVLHGLGADLARARELGSYTLEEMLGRGGMGEVWRARHEMLSRPAAIKLIRADESGEGEGAATPTQIARFEREVQLTTRLSHPNTITIYDYGRTGDGTFYYVMELLEGASLATIVDVVGPQPPQRVRHILSQALGALEEAHGTGLVHRDIKPANIMLCSVGGKPDFVKLLDFGLVKDLADEGDVQLTGEGRINGTPLYLAPESIASPDSSDERSDIYALGAVAYYLLTGEHVFSAKSLVEICAHHLHTMPISPSKRLGAEIPEELERLVLDCLAKEPDDRPQSAAEMLGRLAELQLPPWTLDDATEWWSEYGAALRPKGEDPQSGT